MTERTQSSGDRSLAARYAPGLVIALTLCVLGGTIFVARGYFRERIREQIAGRDARVLYGLWLGRQAHDSPDNGLALAAENAADQFEAILEMTQAAPVAGTLATRLFDTNGHFVVALPPVVSESELTPKELQQLRRLQPVSRFLPDADLADLAPASASGAGNTRPLLEITLPLHKKDETRLLGIAQFVLDGSSLAQEFAALDRTMTLQAVAAFLGGGGIVAIVLSLAFHQLQKVNRLLSERTKNLLQANQELTWAAKASAIGAVTSHLIHGLKNPLSGLQNFMGNRGTESPPISDTE